MPVRELPQWLTHIEDEDYQFMKRLVLASGSLKELAAEYGVSYPTIRVRLDRLIERIRAVDAVPATDPLQARIRALVADGEISGARREEAARGPSGGAEWRPIMTDAWFSPETARLFSLLSLLSLCSLFAIPAKKGQLRGLAMGVWNTVIGFGVLLLGAGVVAASTRQPWHVSYALLVSGLVLAVTFFLTRRVLISAYEEAAVRRTVAADL